MSAIEENRPVTMIESGVQINQQNSVVELPTENPQEMRFFLQGELDRIRSIRDVASAFTIMGGTGVLYTASALIDSHVNQIISSEMDIWAKTASIAAFVIGTIGVMKSNSHAHTLQDSISELSRNGSDAEPYTAEFFDQTETSSQESYSPDLEPIPVYFE